MVELLHPIGLASLASLAAITILYFYVFRGRPIEVSHLFLWDVGESLRREGRRWVRPPLTLPFVLEMLSALLLALLVAGLAYGHTSAVRHAVVVLDSSASMNAGDGPAAFRSRALKRIEEVFRALGPDSRVTLVVSGFGGDVLAGGPLTLEAARQALARWRPAAPDHSLGPAVAMARSLAGEGCPVLVLTDHKVDLEGCIAIGVGQPLDNTGWVAAHWSRPNELFAVARHFGSKGTRTEVVLRGPAGELARKELDFSSRRSIPLSFRLPERVRRVQLELPPDALPNDNVLVLTRPVMPSLNVQVDVADEQLAAEIRRALAAIRSIRVREGSPPALVFAGEAEGQPGGDAFRVAFHVSPSASARAFVGPYVVDPFDPLTNGIQLEGTIWSADPELKAEGRRVLISVGELPLVLADARGVTLNVLPAGTTLFQMPAWPVFISNLAWAVHEAGPGLKRFSYRLGESLSFTRPADWKGPIEIVSPEGEVSKFEGRQVYYGAFRAAGVYSVRAGGREVAELDVNLLSEAESDLTGAASYGSLAELNPASLRRTTMRTFGREFALVVAVLLLSCWWWLERRSG